MARRLILLVLGVALAGALAACGDDAAPGVADDPTAWLPPGLSAEARAKATAAFNRGVSLMDHYEAKEAIPHFEEALRHAPDWTTARFNLGIACLNAEMAELYPRAEQELMRVVQAAPGDPRAHFALAMLRQHLGAYAEAEAGFRRVLELDPGDPYAHFRLGLLIEESDPAEARAHLEATVASIPHHEAATYHLYSLVRDAGEAERAQELLARFTSLKEANAGLPSGMKYTEMGRYADAVRAFERKVDEAAAAAFPQEDVAERLGIVAPLPTPASGPGLACADLDGDGDLDLVFAGTGAAWLQAEGRFAPAPAGGIDARDASSVWLGDMDADGDPDAFLVRAGPDRLLRNDGGTFVDVTEEAGVGGGTAVGRSATWFDADHDGDLDLYVANDGPDELWRNDGNGRFTPVAKGAGLDGGDVRTVAAIPVDVDGDSDFDLFVVNDGAPNRVWRNDRVGAWTDVSGQHPLLAAAGAVRGAVLADLDGDLDEDAVLVPADGPARLLRQGLRGHFVEDAAFAAAAERVAAGAILADPDLDGDLDVLLLSDGRTPHRWLVNRGAGSFVQGAPFGAAAGASGARSALAADLDADGTLEVVVARPGVRPEVWRVTAPEGRRWLEVRPDARRTQEGAKPAPDVVGLHVEVKVGPTVVTGRLLPTSGFLGSPPPLVRLGLGTAKAADYVRLVWPDGMLQSEMAVAADQRWSVSKVERKPSSCPVLFAWDGKRFAFVTDFLGVGGVGFFLKPGVYAPPDATEVVRIPPEQIAPKDGRYLLRIAEPLEEITWLDRARLLVHEHDADVEVHPDERFTGSEPFPTGRPIAVRTKHLPVAARDERGRDVLDLVRAADRRQVDVPHDPRFVGFAKDHWLELDFGDAVRRMPEGARVVLFLHGWVEYTYSHVNYAALQAGHEMRSPWIEVPDGNGGWTTAMAECGYPGGLPRVMTVDVTALPLRADGRLRIRTNMQVYWDQAFLGEDVSATGLVTHVLPATAATLRPLGYPREYSPDGQDPTLYDYHRVDPGLPFRAMAGDYTRFGDVRELLLDVDERTVVMNRGDEIALEFDATALPPLPPGRARTVCLDSDGWCKDMDLYTAFPDTVEPTPWHGMDNYPPSEPFPDTEALREYRRTWNTRRVLGR